MNWCSKKYKVVERLSCEAEYMADVELDSELTWLRSLLRELRVKLEGPTILLWYDNVGATSLVANLVFHAQIKHVEIDVHFVREKIAIKGLEIRFMPSQYQITDILTKTLSILRFQDLYNKHKIVL